MNQLKILVLLALIFILNISLKAQTINIEQSEAAEEEYFFSLCYGLEMDTIASGSLDGAGGVAIKLPEENKGYKGLAFFCVKDRPMQILIINSEDFKVKLGNTMPEFENSRENDAFNKKDISLLSDTSLYANRFFELSSYFQSLRSVLSGQSMGLGDRYKVRNYAEEKLNADDLYSSGLWFYVIDGLTQLYPDQESFAKAMISILNRVKSEKVYIGLSENLVTILNQYGWEEAFDLIVPSIVESGRIKYPQGTLYDAFQMAKLVKGALAPNLDGLSNKKHNGQTLVFFFESDCNNCRLELKKLTDAYAQLKEKNIRIVSVSADHDKEAYSNTVKDIPWKDALCDYKGFAGINFLNYGIFATPTYFLLDSEFRVMKRFSQLANIDL